eukprot:Skav228221  [mRNA]  locus=scaffold43:240258:241394:- [translate_table: standard]
MFYVILLLLMALLVLQLEKAYYICRRRVEATLTKLRRRLWNALLKRDLDVIVQMLYVNQLSEAAGNRLIEAAGRETGDARMEEVQEKPVHGVEEDNGAHQSTRSSTALEEAGTQALEEMMAETTYKAWEENILSVSLQDIMSRTRGQPSGANQAPALPQGPVGGDDAKALEEMMAAARRVPCEPTLISISFQDIIEFCEASAARALLSSPEPDHAEGLEAASSPASPPAKPGMEELKAFDLSICSTHQVLEEAKLEKSDDAADLWAQIEENQLPLASKNLSLKMPAELSSYAKATGTTSHFFIGDTDDEEADSLWRFDEDLCHPQVQELLDSFDIMASAERMLNYFCTAGDTEPLEETGTSPLEFFIGDDDVPEMSLP